MVVSERVPRTSHVQSPWEWWMNETNKFIRTNAEYFTLGPKREWTTPNEVVLELPNIKLRRFYNEKQPNNFPPKRKNSLLIAPPEAGHSSMLPDWAPGQSMIETALPEFDEVYTIEWQSATPARKNETLDNVFNAIDESVDTIIQREGNIPELAALCSSGWKGVAYTATYPTKIAHLYVAGAPLDTLVGNGKLKQYIQNTPQSVYETMIAANGGLMDGKFISYGFKSFDFYGKVVKPYLELRENIDDENYVERHRRFRDWDGHTQLIAGPVFLQSVNYFRENSLINGSFKVDGKTADLSKITCDVDLVAGETDDIIPAEQVEGAKPYLTGAKVKFYELKGGHMGVFMGRESQKAWKDLFQGNKPSVNNVIHLGETFKIDQPISQEEESPKGNISIFRPLPPKIS